MLNQKISKNKYIAQVKMAKKLGIDSLTLSRELKCGKVQFKHSSLEYYYSYPADVAQVYNYILKCVFLNVIRKNLSCKITPKKCIYPQIRCLNKVRIGKQIGKRLVEAGYYEMGSIEPGGLDKTYPLAFVDRYNRETILMKISPQTQRTVGRDLNRIERVIGAVKFQECFKSSTVGNGSEFWSWKQLETLAISTKKRTGIYSVHPYSSWERCSKENLNELIKNFMPKNSRISSYTRKKIKELQKFINNGPRLILNGQSANEFANNAA